MLWVVCFEMQWMPETIVGKDESATIQGMVGPVPVD